MKKILKVLSILMIIILASCEQNSKELVEESETETLIETFTHPQTEQTYKIVDAYKLLQNYENKVEENPNETISNLYKQEVINPIYEVCFKDGEYLGLPDIDEILSGTPTDLKALQYVINKIKSEDTNDLIKEALIKSSDFLPYDKETTVCIFPNTNLNAALGVTVGTGKIIILYNKFFNEEALQTTIAHEYHHSVWSANHQNHEPNTILNNLVFEGKAVMFEKLVYPESNLSAVNYSFNKDYWSQIEPDLDKIDGNRYFEILLGGDNLPIGYGYSEGYKMVESYIDLHPNLSPAEWTGINAKEIFEEGQYAKNYK